MNAMRRALVIGGIRGRWDHTIQNANWQFTNTVEAWVNALQGDYWGPRPPPLSVIREYELVIANLNPTHVPAYARLAKERPVGTRWVSLVEGDGHDYLEPSPRLLEVLDHSDLVATITCHTTAYFRALTRTPVAYIGVPYPVDYVSGLATPVHEREPVALICPRSNRCPSLAVAAGLGMPVRLYVPKVPRTLRNVVLFARRGYLGKDLHARWWRRTLGEMRAEVLLERELTDFWPEAGRCRLWINLDARYTWARYVLDAAALGVPIIATRSTGHAPVLFPETTVENVFAVGEAVRIGRRLLAEPSFAEEITARAGQGLREYSAEACVERLKAALRGDHLGTPRLSVVATEG
jgi:hypothetical protein